MIGIDKYKKALRMARKQKEGVDEKNPEQKILHKCLVPMVEGRNLNDHQSVNGLRYFMEVPSRTGKLQKVRKYIKDADPYELAYVTIQTTLNYYYAGQKLTAMSHAIGKHIMDHLSYKNFKAINKKGVDFLEYKCRMSGKGHTRKAIQNVANRADHGDTKFIKWPKDIQRSVGLKLLSILVKTTGMFTLTKAPAKNAPYYVTPTQELIEKIDSAHEYLAGQQPLHLPMIIPPKPWTNFSNGGHISQGPASRYDLVSTRSNEMKEGIMKSRSLDQLYDTVNHLQATPWVINKDILEVADQVRLSGTGLAGTPPMRKEFVFHDVVRPWGNDAEHEFFKTTRPSAYKRWCKRMEKRWGAWNRGKTKRHGLNTKVWIGRKFADEDAMYFCYNGDWRGRIYTIQSHVGPQSDDLGKAICKPKEGKALGGPDGVYYFKAHGAGVYAEQTPELGKASDKLPWDERVAWTDRYHDAIIDSAEKPLDGSRFWLTADKPFQFLAWCFEYAGFAREGESFVSHIPVALDGSNSGLQHLSATICDEHCGSLVNISANDEPADVYEFVADITAGLVDADAGPMADLWSGKVGRSECKRAVMTVVYGARPHTFKRQLMDYLQKLDDKGKNPLGIGREDWWEACDYLGEKINIAIRKVIRKGFEVMEWLQAIAKVFGKANLPMWWTTPGGLRITQVYPVRKLKQIKTFFGSLQINLGIREDVEGKMDTSKLRDGITPNWTHGMDSNHLQSVVCDWYGRGHKMLSVIHDSFGTYAADTAELSMCLRETFRDQYKVNHLERFLKECKEQLPVELHGDLPQATPEFGKWQPTDILDAVYAFA
jgi:DNA-directed RNA polymerase